MVCNFGNTRKIEKSVVSFVEANGYLLSKTTRKELYRQWTLENSSGVKMKGYLVSIEKETVKNSDFRHVLYTGKYSQLVLMSLKPGEEIGSEVHTDVDQFFRFEKGSGKVEIDGVAHAVKDGDAVVVPAGAKHNVVNVSKKMNLRLYTIYSPPEHQDGTVRHTKKEALEKKERFDGKTTE